MKKTSSLIAALILIGSNAFAADSAAKSKKFPEPTKEQREKMAEMHEKMASCLKSDRPVSDCHKDMMEGCKETMGKDGCPMMGGKKGRGMHHHMSE